MDCKVEIPFKKDSKSLPAPLPREDQIRDCPNIIHGNEPSADQKVVVIGPYAIKYGKYLSQLEGENLLFLERYAPRIPAPKLYAMWRGDGTNSEFFIIMDRVPGIPLNELWPILGDLDKTQILNKLRDIFESLHSLPSSGFFGSIHRGPIPYHLFWDAKGDPTITGPFNHGREMIIGLAKRSRANSALNGKHPYLAEFFERHLAPALDDHSPTFCHSDVQPKNIIVNTAPEDTMQGRDFRVSIIDWEVAGWYPSYWEYAAAFLSFRWDEDDWPNRSEDFIPVRAVEAAMLRLIHQDLWF